MILLAGCLTFLCLNNTSYNANIELYNSWDVAEIMTDGFEILRSKATVGHTV